MDQQSLHPTANTPVAVGRGRARSGRREKGATMDTHGHAITDLARSGGGRRSDLQEVPMGALITQMDPGSGPSRPIQPTTRCAT